MTDALIETISEVVSMRCKEFEERINQRLDFVLKEAGLDGILPGFSEVRGHAVHPDVAELVMALNRRLMKAHDRIAELERALVKAATDNA